MTDWRDRVSRPLTIADFVEGARMSRNWTGPPDVVSPREWRAIVRSETRRLGWTREEMRAYLAEAGLGGGLDPWRIPLPMLREGPSPLEGLMFGISER